MLRKLLAVGAKRRGLLVSGVGWVLTAQLAVRFSRRTLPEQKSFLDGIAARLPTLQLPEPSDAAWAVTQAARRLPGTRCVAWSLALRGLLAQAGIASELRIGVAPDGRGGIRAHAWVESAGQTWSWGDMQGYAVLSPPRSLTNA
jgi:hypothetical protein